MIDKEKFMSTYYPDASTAVQQSIIKFLARADDLIGEGDPRAKLTENAAILFTGNHSDPKCTMRYLKTFRTMYDKARITVSDFTLGKTDVNTLVAGTSHSIDQLFAKMEELENTINGMKQFQEEKHCC